MRSRTLTFLFFLALAQGCGASPQPIATAVSLRQYPFQQGLQQGLIKQVIDDNTIRVILTDTGAMRLGQCTDAFGSPLPSSCVERDHGVVVLNKPDEEIDWEGLEQAGEMAAFLDKGIFGQYVISETAEFSGSANAIGSSSDAKHKTQRHRVVYEWSKYAVVGLHDKHMRANVSMVSSADFGFAVRMIFDVVIRETAATADLNLGPGQLEAALALGVAEVSVRYQVLGMRMAMLPDKSYDIKSYSDVQVALEDFHKKAKIASEHWKDACAAHGGGDGGAGECSISPVMLAYYVNGQSVGKSLRDRRRVEDRCNAAEAAVNALAEKKLQSKNAYLSDSDWKRYKYAEERMERCKVELEELLDKAATKETRQGSAGDKPGSAVQEQADGEAGRGDLGEEPPDPARGGP